MAPNQQTQIQVSYFSKLPQLDGVEVIKGDVPSPGEGEVLCQIFLRPVNPTDVHAVQGLRPIGPHHTPHIAGGEGEQATSTHVDTALCSHDSAMRQGTWYATSSELLSELVMLVCHADSLKQAHNGSQVWPRL